MRFSASGKNRKWDCTCTQRTAPCAWLAQVVLSAVPVQAPAQPLRRCQHVRMRTHAKRTLNIVSNVSAARSTSPYIACDA